MALINNDCGREKQNDQEVIRWDNSRSIDTEWLDGHHGAHHICQECDGCCARGDGNGPDCSSPRITHSLFQVTLVNRDQGTLPPCIDEHKNVVSGNTKYNKNDKIVQSRHVLNSKDALVDYRSKWEWEADEGHANGGQEPWLQVKLEVKDHK